MQPIRMTVAETLQLLVVPDSQAHADGHPVLTYTYKLYRNLPDEELLMDTERLLQPGHDERDGYLGYIDFVQPGKAYTYVVDGGDELPQEIVEEIIERIEHLRHSPEQWTI